ncbi:FxLYD domain-containing protein [Streptomyces rishiriensis]|uniref:Outer membrane murein-binding lipoprotein Lpp n=1 Tax=Streptomyces rishiriensis TaxID=68264 RepID=A0ABU0NT67_STRRH|nr:FxLYD domain-containing protein [Streptomyces rishiriensis]MDQ0582307.1 outer membrane murein-binding lipoprotein Lpp [Streptomyces rishiriensis]
MPRTTSVLLTTAAICCAALLTGCSDDDTPSSVSSAASRAASAAESLGREATAAASSLASGFASEASSAFASASASASRELDEIKDGVDARSDVKLGTPATDGDDRATVDVTVSNSSDKSRSFSVQVDFTDSAGNRLDTVVTTVSDVAAGKTGKATARSNRTLSGAVKAEVARAVRY